jgi:hypothetical protein
MRKSNHTYFIAIALPIGKRKKYTLCYGHFIINNIDTKAFPCPRDLPFLK